MATEKNITMKQFNGADYDTLYPKTIASQIPDVYSKTEALTLIDSKARIQTGSYVGTGTYGPNHPCSLTFDVIPYFVYIQSSDALSYMMFPYIWGSETLTVLTPGGSYKENPATISENTMSWHVKSGTTSPDPQLNRKNTTYNYIAIGF